MDQLITIFKDLWLQTSVAIVAGLITLFHKKIIKWISWIINRIVIKFKLFFDLRVTCPIPGIRESLDKIQAELRPNGGSSLRDAVNKIDRKVTGLSTKLVAMQVSHDIMSDTLNICRWAADINGKVNFVNNPLRELTGSVDDSWAIGDGWTNAVLKDDRDEVIREWRRCVESQIEYNDTYRICNRHDGKIKMVTSHAKISRNLNTGAVEGWIGVVIPHDKKSNIYIPRVDCNDEKSVKS